MHLYLAVFNTTISSTLIKEDEDVQRMVYYTKQAFKGAKVNYLRLQKITFALVVASRKLRHYFQIHAIVIMINQPIRKTMNKIDAAGLFIQWVIDLGQFDIEYWPRVAIKAQVLIDFIAKFIYP